MICSPFITGVISILCALFENCLNLSNHCFGVYTGLPLSVSSFQFGLVILSVDLFILLVV